jgi:hypothetical protein
MYMKNNKPNLTWILSLLIVSVFISSSSAGTGDLQVISEQGFEIYIDDVLAGTSNGFDRGLFVEGLEPGPHTLRAEKKGFEPVLKKFNITGFGSRMISIGPDDIKQIEGHGETAVTVGTFRLRSAPMGAAIYIDDIYKGETDITVGKVKAGTHKIRFEKDGSALEGDFTLNTDETLTLKAHFKDMEIINISVLEKEERAKETEEMAFNDAARASSSNNVDAAILAWSRFVEKYPEGVHAREGRQQLVLWEDRKENDLFFFEGEWIAANIAADKLKNQSADWVQLDIGISLKDLVVAYVTPASPAGKVGIQTGDVFLEVDKKRMKKVSDVQKSLRKGKKEKPRLILLQRNGKTVFVELVF